jgi:hypothetical protein
MPKSHKTLLFDELVLVWNPPYVHVSCAGPPSRETLEKLGPPRLLGGTRADHLTIPLEVRRRGPHAGRLNIHLTYGTGRDCPRVTVAALAPESIAPAIKPFEVALLRYYLSKVRLVTVDSLRRDGYVFTTLNAEAEAWLDERTEQRRWKERVTEKRLDRAMERAIAVRDVEILDELRDDLRLQPLAAVRQSDGFMISVGFQPNGLPPNRPPGWYAMPMNNGFAEVLDQAIGAALPPAFYDAAIEIVRELQAPANVDALIAGRARAQALRSPSASSSMRHGDATSR